MHGGNLFSGGDWWKLPTQFKKQLVDMLKDYKVGGGFDEMLDEKVGVHSHAAETIEILCAFASLR